MDHHIEYFDFALNLARAHAMSSRSETADIDRHNDECFARSDMLEAAKDSDIEDRAFDILSATDPQTLASLSDWFIEELLKEGHAALISKAKEGGEFFKQSLHVAAKKMAADEWDEKYGS